MATSGKLFLYRFNFLIRVNIHMYIHTINSSLVILLFLSIYL